MKKWFEGEASFEGNSRLWNTMYKDPCGTVFVGPNPCSAPFTKAEADSFDIILNVGDNLYTFEQGPSREGQQVYWYPLIEMGRWHYSTLFPCFHILDKAITEKKRIYVHCAAGAYRSPGIVELWHQSRFDGTSRFGEVNGRRSLKRYMETHCGPEFKSFCKAWRKNQNEGNQYSLMSILTYGEERLGIFDEQLLTGQYLEDHKEFRRKKENNGL